MLNRDPFKILIKRHLNWITIFYRHAGSVISSINGGLQSTDSSSAKSAMRQGSMHHGLSAI